MPYAVAKEPPACPSIIGRVATEACFPLLAHPTSANSDISPAAAAASSMPRAAPT
ncbi:MAG TPA: hypothetical protein VLW50_21965 [Streptosporangiaceae bacterium]|nr:hypothetical protein [Streptosporangiaceae bacterium]